MTDRDGRSNDSKTCQTEVLSLNHNIRSSSSTSVNLNETNSIIIQNTDSEGDYETSSEGPHSPKAEFKQSTTTFAIPFDDDFTPESNDPLFVSSTPDILPEENPEAHNDPNASYTIIGTKNCPRTDVTSNISDKVLEIELPLKNVDELETPRTEYYLAPRVEMIATKSESLPVITIATPWGSYEYPDVDMPAERLVSDSPVDIKGKMRLIAECMDHGSDLTTSRTDFLDDRSIKFFHQDVKQDFAQCKIEDNIGYCSRPVTPRTPKLISVTSPMVFSEPFNVLPIIRNPNFGFDYTVPQSPSGSSLPITTNNNTVSISSSLNNRRDIYGAESPRNLISGNKSVYDPLSRIEGELAPLQNELSEIRGKVRALNLDYNLSCIDGGIGKMPKTVNWMTTLQGNQNTSGKDDFVLTDYQDFKNQNGNFNPFRSNNQTRYRDPFAANRWLSPSSYSYDLDNVKDMFQTSEKISVKDSPRPEVLSAQISTSEHNCQAEVVASGINTDRKLSHVYVCTSKPSVSSSRKDILPTTDSKTETEYSEEKEESWPEIRLPDFLDKISIVPITYLGGMPDPPAEPAFNFKKPKEEFTDFEIPHRVLRIEHPDAPQRNQDFKKWNNNLETSMSISDTILTSENETETSLSTKKEQDNDNDSSIENSARSSENIISKLEKPSNSYSHYSIFTDRQKSHEKSYIRGLVCGPEDFL